MSRSRGEDEKSFRDSNLGGWNGRFFAADILSREGWRKAATGLREAAADNLLRVLDILRRLWII